MSNITYKGNQASDNAANANSNWLSPFIWGDCPIDAIKNKQRNGVFIYESFLQPGVLVTPTITTQAYYANGFKAFGSSGGTIVPAGLQYVGGLTFTESDDDQGLSIQTIALPFKIALDQGPFWFEASWDTNEVANTKHGIFVGLLGSATLSATVPIAAAGTLADVNFVGFHRLEGDGDQLDQVYKANGVSQVNVDTDALSTALTATTYIKTGMKYDPADGVLRWYTNGIELSETKTIPSAAGTDFPNDVLMGLCFATLCASDDDAICHLKFIAGAQVEP